MSRIPDRSENEPRNNLRNDVLRGIEHILVWQGLGLLTSSSAVPEIPHEVRGAMVIGGLGLLTTAEVMRHFRTGENIADRARDPRFWLNIASDVILTSAAGIKIFGDAPIQTFMANLSVPVGTYVAIRSAAHVLGIADEGIKSAIDLTSLTLRRMHNKQPRRI